LEASPPSQKVMEKEKIDLIREYYDKTGYMYRWFYTDKESLGLHYGFWDDNTISVKEALINVYKEVRDLINPKKGQLILDAGCGVGGASLWLAKNSEAKYEGVTISPNQLRQAISHAQKRGLEEKVSFSLMDYHKTDFPDAKFDAVFFIESSCYGNLNVVCGEMIRILKPGGKLIIADFSNPRSPSGTNEKKMVGYFCKGFKLPKWLTREDYLKAISGAGFKNISFEDKTIMIKKSVEDIYGKTLIVALPFLFLRLLGLISKVEFENGFATYSQKKLYDMGLFQYGIFSAKK